MEDKKSVKLPSGEKDKDGVKNAKEDLQK